MGFQVLVSHLRSSSRPIALCTHGGPVVSPRGEAIQQFPFLGGRRWKPFFLPLFFFSFLFFPLSVEDLTPIITLDVLNYRYIEHLSVGQCGWCSNSLLSDEPHRPLDGVNVPWPVGHWTHRTIRMTGRD